MVEGAGSQGTVDGRGGHGGREEHHRAALEEPGQKRLSAPITETIMCVAETSFGGQLNGKKKMVSF